MATRTCLLLLALFMTCGLFATATQDGLSLRPQEAMLPSATEARLRADMSALASAKMRGRRSGTREYRQAAEYVSRRLASLHVLPVFGSSLLAKFGTTRAVAMDVTLAIAAGSWSTAARASATCALPGSGAEREFTGLPLRPLQRGASGSSPHIAVSEGGPLAGDQGVAAEVSAHYTEKRALAASAGAVALLILEPVSVQSPEWRAGRPSCARGELTVTSGRQIPVILVSLEAADQIREAMARRGVRASLKVKGRRTLRSGINIVGRVGPALRETVVVTAHLDHIGEVSDANGRRRVAPGAIDNASGVAALLELARRFAASPLQSRTVIFAATDAEEAGLLGSSFLVEQLEDTGTNVVANINIDGATMMQHPLAEIVVLGGRDSTLGHTAKAAAAVAGLGVTLEHTPIRGSDHFPFALAGVPAVWLVAGTEGAGDKLLQDRWMETVYHTPNDSMQQRLDFSSASRLVDVLESMLRQLTQQDEPRPEWKPGTFWAIRARR